VRNLFPYNQFIASRKSEDKMKEIMPGLFSLSFDHKAYLEDRGQTQV